MAEPANELTTLTAQIVTAYIMAHPVQAGELPALLRSVYAVLDDLVAGDGAVAEGTRLAVPVRKSVFPDHVICLECGFTAKMLRRHLSGEHGMTPEDYRAKWRLPPDHPIVAPDYAKTRSRLAKEAGLGRGQKSRWR